MLGKLIKYEFKQMKFVLLVTAIGLAIITGIVICLGIVPMWIFGRNDVITEILAIFLTGISALIYVFILLVAGIGMQIYIGVRFYKTMYSGIGYFTNSLPIKRHELILGKVIPAVIIQTIVTIIIIASGAIIFFGYTVSKDGFEDLMLNIARLTGGMLSDSGIRSLGVVLGLTFVGISSIIQIASITMTLFLSATVGQLFNSNRILMSVIAFVVMNRVFSAIDAIIRFIIELLVDKAYTYNGSAFNLIFMILTMALNIIIMVICYTVSYYIIKNKLNLE